MHSVNKDPFMSTVNALKRKLRTYADSQKAKLYPRFFKAGKGEYGEGDQFIGVTVPNIRRVAKQYKDLSFEDIQSLLYSPIHEERLVALLILVHQFQKGDEKKKKEIYDFYLSHTKRVNNWDLVDLSAPNIVSMYLLDKPRTVLYTLALSDNLWERRISIMGTFAFITKKNEYEETFKIAELLLHDKHDLIHKAVGWMLREVGKRVSREKEEEFLKKHYKTMPRTMLRYAIEHFPEEKRKAYLNGKM